MTRLVDWRPLAEALAKTLTEKGIVTSPELETAFAEVPRHVFVPTFYAHRHDPNEMRVWWEPVTEDAPDWLTTVYSDATLVTQLLPTEGQPGSTVPSSSTTMPSVMADMIEELGVRPGMAVLESGTGTGYGAALLCHLLGEHQTTTVDIDAELVRLAESRLSTIGCHPTFLPQQGGYDRILSTHAVDRIPAAWLDWCKPGAIILTDFRSADLPNVGAWAKLTVHHDGTASGRLMPSRGAFMSARTTAEYARAGSAPSTAVNVDSVKERTTSLPGTILGDPAFTFYIWSRAPDLTWLETPDTTILTGPGDQWTNVNNVTVHYGHPHDLWATVERLHTEWEADGRPSVESWTLAVTTDGQTLSL